jgi:hypothetical protein
MRKPTLKKDDLVQNRSNYDYADRDFIVRTIPALSVGKVKEVFSYAGGWLVKAKFYGHPWMLFLPTSLKKVRLR